jgi:hypothetical protein
MRLSEHFSLQEFEASATAARRGIVNRVPDELMPAVTRTAEQLEIVRARLGAPIILLSGYRSPELNRAVGGARNSQHMRGEAADIIVPRVGAPLEVCHRIVDAGVVFDQLIHEYGGWTHVSFVPENPRRQVLTIDRRGTRLWLWEART